MLHRPLAHALVSITVAGLVLAACGGGNDSATDTASADGSGTTAAVAVVTTPPAQAAPGATAAPATPAPVVATSAPAATAPAATDGEGFDDPDTCDEAIAYIEGLAGQGLELLEMPSDDALDVMGAMNVLSSTCDPNVAMEFIQRPDIVEFMN